MRAALQITLAAMVGSLVLLPLRAYAVDIIPSFASSITSAPNAAQIENTIDISTAAIGSLFTNPGTVKILFEYEVPTNADFLGESFTQAVPLSYADYTALLKADSLNNPDNTVLATAVANLPEGNDANGNKPVSPTTAMLRVALGDAAATPCYNAKGNYVSGCNSIYDAVIVLNASADAGLDFTRPIPVYTGNNVEYDAIETEEHEIDEVLGGGGWGSTLAGDEPGATQGVEFGPTDLYRYSAPGTPSYTRAQNVFSYLSVDGGNSEVESFFQTNDGSDYGDWGPDITACPGGGYGGPGYVQDSESCNNKQSDVTNASPEFAMLESIGYDPTAAALQPVIAWNCSTDPDPANYSGTLNAIKEGSCTQIVTGDSTFTGGTNIDTGTLQLGNGGTTGSVTGGIVDSGTLVFDHSNTVSFSGVISGGGALKQSGTGTLILTGDNTFTGITTITLGDTLQLGNGGTSGSVAGDIANHGTLIFDRSDTLTYGGAITGQGNVALTGGGTIILTGSNTYSGGTTIASGTLQVGNGGTSGVIQGAVTNDGTLAFDRSDNIIFKAQISGTGALAQIGTGTTVLTAASSYSGGTLIGAGTLQVGNGGTTGMIAGTVVDNGTLIFNRTDDISFGGAISGSGAVQQDGSGTLALSGVNTYTGGTSVGTGTLEASSSGALGTGTLSLNGLPATLVLDNGVSLANPVSIAQGSYIDVNGTDSATLSGVLSGSAPFEKDGTGTLVLTGDSASTYSGDIAFHGTLSVGATGALGSGTVTVLGSTLVLADGVTYSNPTVLADDLTVEQDGGDATITGPISSNGMSDWGLTKIGTGTLTLANNNSFVGQTIVQNGLLVVAGVLPGDVTVDSGASLAITGTVGGSVTVAPGASFSPFALGTGFAKATLASYTETDSTLSIRFGGSSTGFASDQLVVPGNVILNGGTLDPHPSSAADFTFDQMYTVIQTPNPVTGTFDNPAGFVANAYDPALFERLRYDLGGVVLEIRHPVDFDAVSIGHNEHAAADAVNSTEMPAGDSWATLLNTLSSLSVAGQGNALHQISGEGLADASRIAGDSLDVFDENLRSHTVDIGNAGGQIATLAGGSHLWIATLGRDDQSDTHDGYASIHTQTGEFAFGGDTTLMGDLTLGVAASFGHPSQDVPSLATSTSGHMDAYGLYGRYDLGVVYINAAVSTDVAHLHEHRGVSFAGVTDAMSADFRQQATLASMEVDGRIAALDNDLEPFLRVTYLSSNQDGFQETDTGAGLGLNVAPLSHEDWSEAVGGRWQHTFHDNDVWLAPDATLALAFNSPVGSARADAAIEGAPTNTGTFAITAEQDVPMAEVLGLGITAGTDGTPVALHLDYEGRVSPHFHSDNGEINLTYSW